ncbi:MAG TPA: hypothetical protein VFS00_07690, partial [Polyangiaceae bacterium]|nr:hypothetical protein [Polyangiaceae bacterium]
RLEPGLSRVTVNVTGRTRALAVTLDDVVIGEAAYGTPLPVDPGEHQLRASAPDHLPWQGAFQIGPAGDRKEITVPALQLAPPPPDVRPERRWYGWQTLTVDVASIALLAVGGASEDSTLLGVGTLGYFLGAPTVHWAHGHVGKGFASFGLRAAPIALVLGGVAIVLANESGEGNVSPGAAVGSVALITVGGLASIAAPVADTLAIAREDVDPPRPPRAARAAPAAPPVAWSPFAWPRRDGAVIGFSGTF